MTGPTRYLTLLALAGLVACHSVRTVGRPDGIPEGRPPPEDTLAEGYRIWQDQDGCHLRASSDVRRRFQGEIEAAWGEVSGFRAVGDVAGHVETAPRTIRFDFFADAGGERGFDWRASSGCNRFEVYIDGDARPMRVLLPEGTSPARVPFALCGD